MIDSRSMILQAESKKEYEEVSVKAAVQTAVFDLLYCFTSSYSNISAGTNYQS